MSFKKKIIIMKNILFIFIVISLIASSCTNRKSKKENLDNKRSVKKEIVHTPSRNSENSSPISQTQKESLKILSGAEIFQKYNSAVFMIYTSSGWANYQGSGFFISSTGIGVSNYHVFQGTTKGYENIKLSDGSTFKVRTVLKASADEDIIIFQLETDKRNFNFIPIAANSPKVGEKAYAIGSPLGYENTFSSGEISQIRDNNMLQISVPIDHGSSGGALINEYGEVIGITSSGRDDSGANLNFAIDIKVIKKYLK